MPPFLIFFRLISFHFDNREPRILGPKRSNVNLDYRLASEINATLGQGPPVAIVCLYFAWSKISSYLTTQHIGNERRVARHIASIYQSRKKKILFLFLSRDADEIVKRVSHASAAAAVIMIIFAFGLIIVIARDSSRRQFIFISSFFSFFTNSSLAIYSFAPRRTFRAHSTLLRAIRDRRATIHDDSSCVKEKRRGRKKRK